MRLDHLLSRENPYHSERPSPEQQSPPDEAPPGTSIPSQHPAPGIPGHLESRIAIRSEDINISYLHVMKDISAQQFIRCIPKGISGERLRIFMADESNFLLFFDTDTMYHHAPGLPPRGDTPEGARYYGRTADALASEVDEGRGKPR